MEVKVPHTLVTDTCLGCKEQKGCSEATVLPTKAAEVRVQPPADDPGAGTSSLLCLSLQPPPPDPLSLILL